MQRPPTVVVAYDSLPEGDPATLPAPPPPGGEQVRWIYYTSGTTSDPKGVRHTDTTLVTGGRGLAMAVELSEQDVGSIAFPFAHIAGPDYLVTVLATGFSTVLLESFVPDVAVEVFSRYGVTMAGGSTAFYMAYLNEQRKQPGKKIIPTLRLLTGGGAPMPPEIFHEVAREIGVVVAHGYGMTEIPMICMGSPSDTEDQLAHTVGKPVFGAEVRIVTLEETEAATGVDGEVRVRGAMVCKGYTDPVLSAESFDDLGYFRTGDVGHLRPDGHVVLTGRLKDIIIRKGENISAKEIEDLLYTHPKVGDVAVVGPARPRARRTCVRGGRDGQGRRADALRRDGGAPPGRPPHETEGARAAGGGRRPPPQRNPEQSAQVQAARGAGGQALRGLTPAARPSTPAPTVRGSSARPIGARRGARPQGERWNEVSSEG